VDLRKATGPAADSANGPPDIDLLGGKIGVVAKLPLEKNQDAERALRPLRPYQARALEATQRSVASGHRRVMVQGPTGFGKTLLAAHITRRALDKGNRVIFTVPALNLVDQTAAAFRAEGIECVGIMQGSHPGTDTEQPVQVCSVQTLARRQKPDAAVVIIDEAHLAFESVHQWMANPDWAHVPFIGLSATPWTKGLGNHYDDLIIAATTADLIRDGFLSPFIIFAPSTPDLSGVKTVAGDYHEGQLGEACDTPALVADVITTWQTRGEDRPTLVYGVNRAHAEHLQQRFLEAGVPAEYMDCLTERPDRERTFDRFRSGETHIICNVATLTVGMDLDVRCIIDARPTKSEMRYVQTIGRGLRAAPGKDKLIVLDHAGNALRLGLVTDIHHEHLDEAAKRQGKDDRAERSAPLPRLCDECKAVMPRMSRVCSQCGATREAKSDVVHIDGELVEFGSGQSGKLEPSLAEKGDFFGELKWIATIRGYSEGWAAHKFRERFSHWPNDWRIRSAAPREPSLKTKNWIRSRQIAFARARANG
jgi:DNA repair protein RadD